MPGHGHQDLGSFELHDGLSEVIVDPGRGSYADPEYAGAGVHSGVMIDGLDPAPVNRPYYDDAFRHRVVPQMPEFERETGLYGTSTCSHCKKAHSVILMEEHMNSLSRRSAAIAKTANSFSSRWFTVANVHAVLAT